MDKSLDPPRPVVIADQIGVTYIGGRRESERLVAVRDVSLTVFTREIVSILGPSGCGKSTLLECIAALREPTHGSVWVAKEAAKGRAYVPQGESLLPWLTVAENIGFGLEARGVPRNTRVVVTGNWLRLLQLDEFAKHYPHQLSVGMRQKAVVARALAPRPELVLMDEPFSSVDAMARRGLQDELLRAWATTTATIIFVSHDLEEAIYLADRVVVLTPRPSKVIATVPISLPRPRKGSMRTSDALLEIRRCVASLLEPGLSA